MSKMPIFHLGSPRKTDPTKYQISFRKLRKKLFFGGLGGVRFPGPSKVANCQSKVLCGIPGHQKLSEIVVGKILVQQGHVVGNNRYHRKIYVKYIYIIYMVYLLCVYDIYIYYILASRPMHLLYTYIYMYIYIYTLRINL